MKKSSQITLGLVASVAMAFTVGCRRSTQAQNCVAADNRIVADSWCDESDERQRSNPGMYYPYHWMYGGSSGGRLGDTVFNGSPTPTPGVAISRGGFGSSMKGASGGGRASSGAGA